MIKNLSCFNTKAGDIVTQAKQILAEFLSRENDTAVSQKAWQRPSNLGCLSVRQLASWQKYNHETLLSNLKSPKAWLSMPVDTAQKAKYSGSNLLEYG